MEPVETPTPTRTRDEKRKQLAELEAALAGGQPAESAVAGHCAKYGLSPKRGRADLEQLRQRWARRGRAERLGADVRLGMSLARLERVFAAAVARGDDALALTAEVESCRLLGLYPTPER